MSTVPSGPNDAGRPSTLSPSMITFTPPLTTTMFSPLRRLQRLDLVADVAPLQHTDAAERRRTGGNERARRRHSLRELRLLDGRRRLDRRWFATCDCGPKRARPRATIGGGIVGGGLLAAAV